MKKTTVFIALAAAFGAPASAATQTVTLAVPGMTCAACPIAIKMALSRIEGVSKVDVSYEKREVTVIFDDTRTGIRQLTRATENTGYPSTLKR